MDEPHSERRIPSYCPLCRSRCGCRATVRSGRLVRIEPDPTHPTGSALCAKGTASPDLIDDPARILFPMRRTRPKGDPDPGWRRITWDEALDAVAQAMRETAARFGPEAVAFAVTSPSGTALSDSIAWIERLVRAFGSPNICYATEICNWHKDFAHAYTFGVGVPEPDFDKAGGIVLWGNNPSATWLAHATRIAQAKANGAGLLVVDPRRAGLAAKADHWLRVRPGTDGALALSIAGVMIENGWYDRTFVRRWTNGPLLVRGDTGRFLRADALDANGNPEQFVAWSDRHRRPVLYDPSQDWTAEDLENVALDAACDIAAGGGTISCWTAFHGYAELCRRFPPERTEQICWVPAEQIRAAAGFFRDHRPIAYYLWSGVGQHTNATQTDRAIALLMSLTGSFDAPGGNVIYEKIPTNDVSGRELLPATQARKALGLAQRPLGPPRSGWVTSADLYRAMLEGTPYPVRALLAFGTNLLLSHAAPQRGQKALAHLPFYAHADLFMTPTAQLADIVLPVASPWEREGLRVGFEVSQEAEGRIQWRQALVAPRGEARSDTSIVFALATRLGLGRLFWNGDIDAAYRHLLAPSGLSLDLLREHPEGVQVPLRTRYRKYSLPGPEGGFRTPTRKVELYSETFLEHGYDPLPEFREPAHAPADGHHLRARFPLVLTCAKTPLYCHSQHRSLARLRRSAADPTVEIHPETAADRGIRPGDWVLIESPAGQTRARARLQPALHPSVIVGQHGWWQPCPDLALSGYPAAGDGNANFNATVDDSASDPISGSVPHRAQRCEIKLLPG
jgi:anaerobic selenocysteine-containing dehydrogenase